MLFVFSVIYIGCSFKCILKVAVGESIVNALLVIFTNNAKNEARFKKLNRDL
jgi:hypothetical protein